MRWELIYQKPKILVLCALLVILSLLALLLALHTGLFPWLAYMKEITLIIKHRMAAIIEFQLTLFGLRAFLFINLKTVPNQGLLNALPDRSTKEQLFGV